MDNSTSANLVLGQIKDDVDFGYKNQVVPGPNPEPKPKPEPKPELKPEQKPGIPEV